MHDATDLDAEDELMTSTSKPAAFIVALVVAVIGAVALVHFAAPLFP